MGDQQRNEMETVLERKKRERRENWIVFAYALVGLAICVGSFLLFHYFSHLSVLIVFVSLLDVAYAYVHARIFFKSKDWKGVKIFLIPLLMVIWWAVLFAAIVIVNAIVLQADFSYHFFLYPVFLMPAFLIVIMLFLLIVAGL